MDASLACESLRTEVRADLLRRDQLTCPGIHADVELSAVGLVEVVDVSVHEREPVVVGTVRAVPLFLGVVTLVGEVRDSALDAVDHELVRPRLDRPARRRTGAWSTAVTATTCSSSIAT